MAPGHRLRTQYWRHAQKQKMPNTVPLTVVRMRMRRAKELGLTYKAYAKIRQASGQDILGFLFSSNALQIISGGAKMPVPRDRALCAVRNARKLTLVHRPHSPDIVLRANPVLDAAAVAPRFTESWSEMRARIDGFVQGQRVSGSRLIVVGDTPVEAEWMAAVRAAGYLSAQEYFTPD